MTETDSDTNILESCKAILQVLENDPNPYTLRELSKNFRIPEQVLELELPRLDVVSYDPAQRLVSLKPFLRSFTGPMTAPESNRRGGAGERKNWDNIFSPHLAHSRPNKNKHRRPLGRVQQVVGDNGASDLGVPGKVGYVSVADEFKLDSLEAHYRRLGYYTMFQYDVLHVRLSDRHASDTAGGSAPADAGPGEERVTLAPRSIATTPNPPGRSRNGFDMFIFQYGAIVWWGFDVRFFKIVENDFMFPGSNIADFMVNRHTTQLIHENFPVWCTYYLVSKSSVEPDSFFKSQLRYDRFLIPDVESATDTCTTWMLCASHALAQSAKIDYLEVKIQELTESCKPLPRELKLRGAVTISERRLLELRGEVLSYRLMLKSGSDLLDEPELFWQNAYLIPIFQITKECFEIGERVEALDKKLDADNEILSMIADEFSQRHGARLEWIVIWLVFVEVIIGVLELVLDVKPWFKIF